MTATEQRRVSVADRLRRVLGGGLGSRLTVDSVWAALALGLPQLAQLAASIPVARVLGAEHFGALSIIQGTVLMVTVFGGPTLGLTAAKFVAEHRGPSPERAGEYATMAITIAWIASGVLALAVLLLAPWLCRDVLKAPQLTGAMRLAAPAVLFTGVGGALSGIFAGLRSFRPLAWLSAMRGALTLALLLVGSRLAGLYGAVVAVDFAVAAWVISTQWTLRSIARRAAIPIPVPASRDTLGSLLSFSLPALLGGVASMGANWLAMAIIARGPDGLHEAGVFSAANQWRMAVLFVPTAIGQPLVPLLAEAFGGREAERFRTVLRLAFRLTALAAVLPGLVLVLAAPLVMRAYGTAFAPSAPVMQLLVVAAVVASLVGVIGAAMSSAGRMWAGYLLNLIWALVFLGMTALLAARGALGLAVACLVSYLVHLVAVGAYWTAQRSTLFLPAGAIGVATPTS